MNLPQLLAKYFREVHHGGNWVDVNLKDTLADVTWEQATAKIGDHNTIALMIYHMDYYLLAVTRAVRRQPLDSHHDLSFHLPPIQSEEDWQKLLTTFWSNTETFAKEVEQMPEAMLWEDLPDAKYGSFYRNIQGMIDHAHYHLAQIVLLKKLIGKK